MSGKDKRGLNDEELFDLCAFRYALGRKTYIVGFICDQLKEKAKSFGRCAIETMGKEIEEAEQENLLGDPCDIKEWLELKEYLWNLRAASIEIKNKED